MRNPTKVLLEQAIEFDRERTIAKVVVAQSGGPIRTIITGREPHATGIFVSVKAKYRAMPWESMKAELPAIALAEVASPVHELLAQPHRLEIHVEGEREPWIYFPDLDLKVDQRFANMLAAKVPFAEAAVRWKPVPGERIHTCKLIVEVKDDDDPRNGDKAYRSKLDLAAEVYKQLGWSFAEVIRSRDLDVAHIPMAVREIAHDASVKFDKYDVACATDLIVAEGGLGVYATIAAELGDGQLGRAKLSALHVRRVVAIDLSRPLGPDSIVRLIDDGCSIL